MSEHWVRRVRCSICGAPGRDRDGVVLCDRCAEVCARILETALEGATKKEILEKLREG